jgi:xanthine dehydrogenase YagR molybdenum-binding subunit
MKFDAPATANPIDRMRVVGQPVDRVEGPSKTTGQARYAYEAQDTAPGAVYGHILGASIGKGRITALDVTTARAMPGVLAILIAATVGPLGKRMALVAPVLAGPEVSHYGQPVALVVAQTLEQAVAATHAIRTEYVSERGAFDLVAAAPGAARIEKPGGNAPTSYGDFNAAFAAAPVTVDATYTTPDHSHAMMEPQATVAAWDGDELTVWTSNQMVGWTALGLAGALGMPREKLRVIVPWVGGGFGAKLFVHADAVLAALAARETGRAVKVAYTRAQTFSASTHRPATIQRIRLGAASDGSLTAIAHESWCGNLPDGFAEPAIAQTKLLYAGANRMTASYLAELDLPEGHAMRAPGEAAGMMALEVAMDELAEKLGVDPIELRIRNDTQVDPENPEKSFSQRELVACLRTGAKRFGWERRASVPRARREGRQWLGMGVAAAFRGNLHGKSGARVRIDSDGGVTVFTDMTDIGTGAATIIAQTAAEMMGLELAQVRVELGDSRFPAAVGSGGQFGANGATSGVYAACCGLREAAARQLGFNADAAEFIGGMVRAGNRERPLAEAAGLDVTDAIEFGDVVKEKVQATFGAHFAEVAVDGDTGEVRVRRMLAVCAAGRILNPKTARSQIIGSMTMGLGAALMEEMVVDTRYGVFLNHDLAGYEVPVHADIPEQEVIFLDAPDRYSSPMQATGVGELGLCGVAAAIANAVYNATGARLREYPISADRLVELGLPGPDDGPAAVRSA